MSNIKVTFLLAAIGALFIFVGNMLGGQTGMLIALVISIGINFFSYWFSHKIILKMHKVVEVAPGHESGLYEMVKRLCSKKNMTMPKVYLIPDQTPNAFATGRNPENAAVAATVGICNMLTESELEGVMAHELGHVANRDTLISAIVASFASAIMFLANMMRFMGAFGGNRGQSRGNPIMVLVSAMVAPMAATLIRMAISRTREFGADHFAAKLTGNPEGLASALLKISDPRLREQAAERPSLMNREAASHLYIVNSLSGKSFRSLFSTHPPTEDRVARLRAIT